jgi:prepilin-type N-terminal cleavage/methylation domain-containing protein
MLNQMRPSPRQSNAGFTLIEMAIVIVIVGLLISIVVTVLPSLIQSAKIKKARAELERADFTLEGYVAANGRAPCPDTDGDGLENRNDGGTTATAADDTCDAYNGDLPYRTLGLSSGNDVWQNPLVYAIYEGMIKTNLSDYCTNLESFISGPDPTFLRTTDSLGSTNQAYVLVSGGPKDMDGSNGFFDDGNGTTGDLDFEAANRIVDATYDDLVRAGSLAYLHGRLCTGSGGSGSGSGSGTTTVENCSNGSDDDGDGLTDCEDPDCAANIQCLSAPKVTLIGSSLPTSVIGDSLSHTFQATGGESAPEYYWSLVSAPAELSGKLSLNTWSGALSATLDVCHSNSPFTIRVKAEDRAPDGGTPLADTYDERDFEIQVNQGTLTVRPTPSELPDPDLTVDATSFSQEFSVQGDYVGPFEGAAAWSIQWSGSDPGGFQIDPVDATTARLWKSGASTAGDFLFTLTAMDDGCAANTATQGPYLLRITASGAAPPYTEGMEAEWRFDTCTAWDGSSFDVADELGEARHYGKALGSAQVFGAGKICNAASFGGGADRIVSEVLTGGDIMVFNDEVTLACWFKSPGGGSGSPRLIEFSNQAGDYQYSTAIAYDTDGSLRAWISSSTGVRGGSIDYSATRYNDNQWHHVVYTYSQTNGGNLYVDGDLKQTRTDNPTSDIQDAETFVMGGYYPNGSHGYIGLMDEVMVFQRELTEEEITDLGNLTRASCSGSCYTPPVGDYQMENFPWNGTAGEVIDSGSAGNHGVAATRDDTATAALPQLPTQTTPSGGKVCRSAELVRNSATEGGYLDLGDPADASLDPGISTWTISAWINWDGSTGENIIYNKESLYEARVYNGYLNFAWQPSWVWYGGNAAPVDPDTWTHVTTVYSGSQQILYLNGDRVFARNETGAIGSNSAKLLIGARGSTSPRNFFGGLIDEVHIWNRALAVNEIVADMASTRDCTADSVVISSTSLPAATLGQSGYSSAPSPAAMGGTPPYVWQIVSQDGLSLTMPDVGTGVLAGDIDVCAGDYDITLRVTDNAGRIDEATLPLTVANGSLSVTGLPATLSCDTSTCSWDLSVSGDHVGAITGWTIDWQGADPGGFEIIATGSDTARLRKSGTSTAGSNYRFGLTAADAACPTNTIDTGQVYVLNVSGSGADEPYYVDMNAEWHLDACTWDGSADEVVDSGGGDYHGVSSLSSATADADRQVGKICRAAPLNLGSNSGEYVSLGGDAFQNLGDFSLALWFRIDSLSSQYNTLFSGARSGSSNEILFMLNAAGSQFVTYLGDGATGTFNIGASVADGLWHHVVWTRQVSDGAEVVYLDGTALTDTRSAASTALLSLASGGALIGQEQDSVGGGFDLTQAFQGWVDEVQIFNTLLDQAQTDALRALTHSCSGSCYPDPVGDYRMDESSWTIGQADAVENSAMAAAHGTALGSTAVETADARLCNAAHLSNNDSTIDVSGLPISTQAGDKTSVCFWMNWDGNGSEMPIGWDGPYDLYFHGPTRFGFNTGAGDVYGISGADALAGDWHHVCAVFTNLAPLSNQLYLDGVLQQATVLAGTPQNRTVTDRLVMGSWGYGGYYYDGLLDEVHVYARGLSASEAVADMNRTHGCSGGL